MVQKSDDDVSPMTRRALMIEGGAALAAITVKLRHWPETVEAKGNAPKEVRIVQFSDTGQRQDIATLPLVVKTDAEWQQQLTQASFEVTRHAATERAFSGEYWNNHDKGLYRCICCVRRSPAPTPSSSQEQDGPASGHRLQRRMCVKAGIFRKI